MRRRWSHAKRQIKPKKHTKQPKHQQRNAHPPARSAFRSHEKQQSKTANGAGAQQKHPHKEMPQGTVVCTTVSFKTMHMYRLEPGPSSIVRPSKLFATANKSSSYETRKTVQIGQTLRVLSRVLFQSSTIILREVPLVLSIVPLL